MSDILQCIICGDDVDIYGPTSGDEWPDSHNGTVLRSEPGEIQIGSELYLEYGEMVICAECFKDATVRICQAPQSRPPTRIL